MDADNSFYVKFIATEVPTFFGYIISVLAMVIQVISQLTINIVPNVKMFFLHQVKYLAT